MVDTTCPAAALATPVPVKRLIVHFPTSPPLGAEGPLPDGDWVPVRLNPFPGREMPGSPPPPPRPATLSLDDAFALLGSGGPAQVGIVDDIMDLPQRARRQNPGRPPLKRTRISFTGGHDRGSERSTLPQGPQESGLAPDPASRCRRSAGSGPAYTVRLRAAAQTGAS